MSVTAEFAAKMAREYADVVTEIVIVNGRYRVTFNRAALAAFREFTGEPARRVTWADDDRALGDECVQMCDVTPGARRRMS